MVSRKNMILMLIIVFILVGCGAKVKGKTQKGPFKQGSVVTAYKLDMGVRSTTQKKSTTTNDDKGSFSLEVDWVGATEYEIVGNYLDENSGNYLSSGRLSAVIDAQTNMVGRENIAVDVNINILTHIAAIRIKNMLKNNIPITEAIEDTTSILKGIFSLELDNDASLEDLDLTDAIGENKSDNTQLLKLSAAILNSNNPEVLLEKLTKFINLDGTINYDFLGTYTDILEKADEVDLSKIDAILRDKIGVFAPSENTREGNLPFNHGLSFDTKTDVDINKGLISNYIAINNINGVAKLSIENGNYSLNDGDLTDIETTVKNGDFIKVKHYSSNTYGSENVSTLNIGLSRVTFKSITRADPTLNITAPNSFIFPIKINVPIGGTITSDEIVVSGLSEGTIAKVGISSGAFYKINNGTWKNNTYEDELSFSSVRNGDIIKVSNNASPSYGGKSLATLTVGGVSADFIIYSKERDVMPDLFSPKVVYEADLNTIYESQYFQTSGYEGGLDIEVTNGEVQLEGENIWLDRISQIPISYKVKFRQTSSSDYGTSNKTVIKFGRSIINFETITKTNPNITSSIPKYMEFETKFDKEISTFIESEERVITGMNGSATYAYVSNGDYISINGEAWTTEPVDIGLGTKVKLRIKTGLSYDTRESAELYYGPDKKLFARFSVVTKKKDIEIDDVDFSSVKDVVLDTYYESNIVTISGITSFACANIINGEIKSNGGDWSTPSQKICFENGQTLQVRHKSSQNANESVHTIVNFDTKQYIFKTTTSYVPELLNSIPTNVNQNSNYEFIPNVRDSHILTFSLRSNPSWMSIDSSSGEISGIPTQSDIGVSDTISLVIKSASGLEKNIDFKVTVNDINDAPVLTNTWSSDVTDENTNYSRYASATDIEGGVLTWSISNNPSWLSINSQTGEVSGIPRQIDIGTKEDIKVTVREEGGLDSSFTFKITVIDKNSDAQLLEIFDKTVNENEELIIQIHASDLDGDTLIFNTQNVPSWLNFDSIAQTLIGIPSDNDVGIYENITISVTDGKGTTRFESFKITVLSVNEAPIIISTDFTKEFILDDSNATPNNYIFNFDVSDADNLDTSLAVTRSSVITETRVGFEKATYFTNSTLSCIQGKCSANISFSFQDIDDFHPSLKTRHTFTVSDGDKTASNYIDIWYAPTKPVLGGETSHTIEPKDEISYEAFSFIPTNSGNKARTWSITNKPLDFDFNTTSGEIKYSPLQKGLLLNDTVFKGIEISAENDRGTSEKFIFSILVKGKPAASKFEFDDKIGVEIQQFFDSSIIVDWLEDGKSEIITSSGYLGQTVYYGFNVNGQTGTSGSTSVQNDDKITVWHKSSNEYDTTLDTTITIGENSDTFSTRTKESEATKLPLIVGAPNMSANVGELYTYIPQLSSDYSKFAPATKPFTIENKPSWATFDEVNGKLSGTPTTIDIHNQVRITAYGDNGLDDITFNITVSNDAPYINGYGHSLENPDLSFTFVDNSDWRSKISKVFMYACYDQDLPIELSTSDYTFSEGVLKLHSSTSLNPILRIPIMGGGRLIVEADNYPDSEASIYMIEDGQYAVKVNIDSENPISEWNIDDIKININLSNYLEFADNTLDLDSFSLYEAPLGTIIKEVEFTSLTSAILTLGYTGSNFDEDKNLKININNQELNICQDVQSNVLVITSIEEKPKNILKTGITDSKIDKDDGFYQVGQDRSYAYTDNINYHNSYTDILLDNKTGLQWQNNENVTASDYALSLGSENWNKAIQYCEDLTLGTHDDWRLPSIHELVTIVDYSKDNSSVNEMFKNVAGVEGYPEVHQYWSSTALSSSESFAWVVEFNSGEYHYTGKNSIANLKCVRGEDLGESQFVRKSNEVVIDVNTNLKWQDNEIGVSGSINDAISYCENLTLGDNSWRLPNINELLSLSDHKLQGNSISEVFQNTSNVFYYSSTPNSLDDTRYWLLGFENQGSQRDRVQSNYRTRCVSGNNELANPIVKLSILDGSDIDEDYDHIKLGIELIGTTFSGSNISLIQLSRAPDKDVSAVNGFVYPDSTHAYIIENMENISENITVSFTVHNTEINYDKNITSNSIIIKKTISTPQANAGEDQSVAQLEDVILDASGSRDNNGNIVSYEWKEGITILSTDVTFTKSDFSIGEHLITLTVTDDDGEIGTDTILVTVLDESIFHNGFTYNIVTSPISGKKWLDRNLGASEVCTKSRDDVEFNTDEEYRNSQENCFGDYYQWGRLTDGHEKKDSLRTDTRASSISNAGSKFIIHSEDWYYITRGNTTARTEQWQKSDGTSVCPIGYKVPNLEELESETIGYDGIDEIDIGKVKIINTNTALKNFLKLPLSYRILSAATYDTDTSRGYLLTTTFDGLAQGISFSTIDATRKNFILSTAQPVRCMEN